MRFAAVAAVLMATASFATGALANDFTPGSDFTGSGTSNPLSPTTNIPPGGSLLQSQTSPTLSAPSAFGPYGTLIPSQDPGGPIDADRVAARSPAGRLLPPTTTTR